MLRTIGVQTRNLVSKSISIMGFAVGVRFEDRWTRMKVLDLKHNESNLMEARHMPCRCNFVSLLALAPLL